MGKSAIITCIFSLFLALIAASCGPRGLEKRVHEVVLDNGMKWLLMKRGYAPVFSGVLQVKVGGADEKEGKTGLAHMFEHMAFKGTSSIGTTNFKAEKEIMDRIDTLVREGGKPEEIAPLIEEQKKYIVPNEIWDIFVRNGANNLNAYTSKDLTAYHAEMPSSKLELWMYLISEMISDPAFREFYSERDVVLEEHRTTIDNNPQGKLYSNLLHLAYEKSPYGWPTIGSKEDVSTFTREDLLKFYEAKYVPECMVGAIVGNIDIDETEKLLRKYFGKLKGKSKMCHRNLLIDPPQNKKLSKIVTFNAEPLLVMGFHKPTVPNFDDYIFDIFEYLLCEGEASRLEKVLVKEKRLAKRVSCSNSYPGTRLPNLFVVYAEPFNVDSLDTLEAEITNQLQKLGEQPLSEDELKKVKNQMKTSFLMGINSNFKLAQMLVYFETVADDWHYILNHPKNIDKITFSDLMKAAKRYFTPENMVVVKLRREDGEAD